MYYNRDEFLVWSRTGRVPPGAPRAGPTHPRHELPPAEPWLLQAAVAAVAGMLRHGRAKPPELDRDAYLALEFEVGFAADDDPWLAGPTQSTS
jgi:hypothetical protein